LTHQAYQDIGSVRGALTRHAEATYISLPSEQHCQMAQAIFTRLVEIGTAAQDTTRRRADMKEFTLSDQQQMQYMTATMEAFIKARLVTTNRIMDIETVEVAHEALIREWPRLGLWIQEATSSAMLIRSFRIQSAEWHRRDRDPNLLLEGSMLKEIKAVISRSVLSQHEADFLEASDNRQSQTNYYNRLAYLKMRRLELEDVKQKKLFFDEYQQWRGRHIYRWFERYFKWDMLFLIVIVIFIPNDLVFKLVLFAIAAQGGVYYFVENRRNAWIIGMVNKTQAQIDELKVEIDKLENGLVPNEIEIQNLSNDNANIIPMRSIDDISNRYERRLRVSAVLQSISTLLCLIFLLNWWISTSNYTDNYDIGPLLRFIIAVLFMIGAGIFATIFLHRFIFREFMATVWTLIFRKKN
jgi:hypothetical protein